MSKHIQLSISDPCHENWDNMTSLERGKFCGSCQKQVIDFTKMSDRELAQFFKKPSTGSTCGRFMQDQLDRSIEIPRKRIPWVKYFFQFLIPAFLVSCRENLQGKIKVTETGIIPESKYTTTVGMVMSEFEAPLVADTTCIVEDTSIGPKVDTTFDLMMPYIKGDLSIEYIERSVIIKGNVIDEEDNPIPMASISVENLPPTFITDSLGNFLIKINSNQSIIPVEISSVGYTSKKVNYTRSDSSTLIIKLEPDIKTLDSVAVIADIGTIRGHVTTGLTVCKKSSVISEPKMEISQSLNSFKLYPNPVKSGASIHIEWKQKEAGDFMLQLLNVSGQLIFTKQITINDKASLFELQLPSVVSGNYFVRMTNKRSGKSVTEKIIIQ